MKTTIAMHETARRIWAADAGHPLIRLLYPLSLLFRLAGGIRTRLYDWGIITPVLLPCPVISVGNITVGGTGKTPLVIYLARFLQARGFRPAILSRGYGGRSRSPVRVVSDGRHLIMGYDEAGDEAVLMARSMRGVPVIAGPDRGRTGRYVLDHLGCDVLILDDGFQHRRLHRDLDIVLVDEQRPFGNGLLLPAGPLREPASALGRAGVLVLTGGADRETGEKAPVDKRPPPVGPVKELPVGARIPVLRAYHRPRDLARGGTGEILSAGELRGKRIVGFCGIGKPENFRGTLSTLGAAVAAFIAFPDHHRYGPADLAGIETVAIQEKAECIVTTEKDGVRLGDFPRFLRTLLVLRIEMAIMPSPEVLEELVLQHLRKGHKK